MASRARSALAGVAAVLCLGVAHGQGCDPRWVGGFATSGDLNGTVNALAVYDDGSGAGNQLYAGGTFTIASGSPATRIAKWDAAAQRWKPLGSGVGADQFDAVHAMVVYDDRRGGVSGAGPSLYVAGSFNTAGGIETNYVARWDGASWHSLGTGLDGLAFALATFNDGLGPGPGGAPVGGPSLYISGAFRNAGGISANAVVRWNGTQFSAVQEGIRGFTAIVYAMTVYTPPNVGIPRLFFGGTFNFAGQTPVTNVAAWTGTTWVGAGAGLSGETVTSAVRTLAVYEEPGGNALFAGGDFTRSGATQTLGVARWTGGQWSGVGGGMTNPDPGNPTGGPSPPTTPALVSALAVFADGQGIGGRSSLYAAGAFGEAGGVASSNISRWDGQQWSPVFGGLLGPAHALLPVGGAGAASLFAGGAFNGAGEVPSARVIRLRVPEGWSPLGLGMNSTVQTLLTHDLGAGAGPELFVGGAFTSAGGDVNNRVTKWNGVGWTAMGQGLPGTVRALASLPWFGERNLYAGGVFTATLAGATANSLARWTGQEWRAISPGGGGVNGVVHALEADLDFPQQLYVGGDFNSVSAGGVITPAGNLARWDGVAWRAVGSGVNGPVYALRLGAREGGRRPLYVGGSFITVGFAGNLTAASNIAKWSPATESWSTLGPGLSAPVYALHFSDVDGINNLYVGGDFGLAGEVPVRRVARWNLDSQQWFPLGSGLDGRVYALATMDDGEGRALFVGGDFPTAGLGQSSGIAKWTGAGWRGLDGGVSAGIQAQTGVRALATIPARAAGGATTGFEALAVGGEFTSVGGTPSGRIAIRAGCGVACPGDANGDNLVNATDLNLVLSQYSQVGAPGTLQGDVNRDGVVNFLDLNLVLSAFGRSC